MIGYLALDANVLSIPNLAHPPSSKQIQRFNDKKFKRKAYLVGGFNPFEKY